MKKLIKYLMAFLLLFFAMVSCGERGPTGPEGPPGPPGPEILPVAFEFNATINQQNGFEFFQEIPSQIDVFEQDVMLVFVLEDYIPEDDLEVWRKLPITEFNSRGTLLFDYDFTVIDVRLFLDANYNLGSNDGFEDVLIRAVHIPADFMAKMKGTNTIKDAESIEVLEQLLGVDIRRLK